MKLNILKNEWSQENALLPRYLKHINRDVDIFIENSNHLKGEYSNNTTKGPLSNIELFEEILKDF